MLEAINERTPGKCPRAKVKVKDPDMRGQGVFLRHFWDKSGDVCLVKPSQFPRILKSKLMCKPPYPPSYENACSYELLVLTKTRAPSIGEMWNSQWR